MAANTLTIEQRDDIARRLAAGEKYPSIAAAVGCSIDNVKYHARKKKPLIAAAKVERVTAAVTAGLSEKAARIAQLEQVNAAILADLAQGYYGVDVKMSATGRTVEVPVFKQGQVTLLLRTLDDIAKEEGGRRTNLKVDGDLNVHNTYADVLAAAEADNPGSAGDHQP